MARCTLARRLAASAPPVSASALPVNCPSCTTVSPPGAQFCASCGNALPREEAGDRVPGCGGGPEVPGGEAAGRGGNGPGLPRHPAGSREAGGAQAAPPRAAARPAHRGSLPARGQGGQPAQPPQLHRRARLRADRGRRALHRHGVRRRARPAPAPHRRLAASGDPGHPHRRPGALRPGRCPSGQCHPPRPEAGERDGGGPPRWRDRRGEGARLRHRQDHRPQRRGGTVAHPDRLRLRHPGVHEPGAGQGRATGCPERPLLGGSPALPDGDPAAALQLRLGDGLRHQAPHRATQGPQRAPAGGVQPGAGGGHPLGPAQGAAGPPADRRRPSSTR